MKIGLLTSSRADFGIYTPLLKRMFKHDNIQLEIIAFGTHLSRYHGYTLGEIETNHEAVIHKVYGMPLEDDPASTASAFGTILSNFAHFWSEHSFDYVLCLGDRFEMCAAVQAGIPLQVKFAHLHGGETTLGAIDNIYRHQITLASDLHFPSTRGYRKRIIDLLGSEQGVHWVGAISIQDIEKEEIPEWNETRAKFEIPLFGDYVLATVHPETIRPENNEAFAEVIYRTFLELADTMALVITLPNADSYGTLYRNKLHALKKRKPDRVFLIENFGRKYYFSAMKHASFLLGNSSSGIIEAASLGKSVINIGDRQKGRAQSENVENVCFNKKEILEACSRLKNRPFYSGDNVYHKADGISEILNHLLNE